MIIIEAPNEVYSLENEHNIKLFLAGGISNCPDWQSEFIADLERYFFEIDAQSDVTIFNPRRKDFDITNPNESERQIVWEHRHLEESDVIVYWFSRGSLNPIVLYELGKYINTDKEIIVGIDPEYERKGDVITQCSLLGYDVVIDDIRQIITEFVHNYI